MLSKFDLDAIRAALDSAKLATAPSKRDEINDGLAALDRLIDAEQCNGWSNWETWNVKLWLDNEQGTYDDMRQLASISTLDTGELAEAIKDYCEELTQGDEPPASMATDLLRGALSDVNWQEIAAAYVAEGVE